MRTNYRKNNYKKIVVIVISVVVLLGLLFNIVYNVFRVKDYRDYVNLAENEIGLNVDLEYKETKNPPIIQNNEIYMPVDLVKLYIDEYIFWDENEDKITITNEQNVIRMQTEKLEYFINNESLSLDLPIYNIDGIAYLPMSFLSDFYQFNFEYNEDSNMLDIIKNNYKTATVTKNAKVTIKDENNNLEVDKIEEGSTIYYKEKSDDKHTKVRTENGFIGEIPTKYIADEKEISVVSTYEQNYETKAPWAPTDGKINLVFDQMQNVVASTTQERRTPHAGVDVLVPTWFSFKDGGGEIINIADKGYVDWAHQNGYQVWGLITDNFNGEISHKVLTSTETREYVIKQLLAFVSIYELDGINIDFESVPKDDGEYFVQFLRELAPGLKEQGAILSVDVFVPKPWTEHYNREETAKIADYLIVMGYDEHYAGSSKAGSVASLSWSDTAIKDTLAQSVPKEKLILGIPFYARVWTETLIDGEIELSSKAYGMNGAYNFIKDKGGEFIFDEKTQQYYGEVKEDNKTYKVWLEDESSVEKRVELALDYDIAGVGAWKRGLEKDSIWVLLEEKLKK